MNHVFMSQLFIFFYPRQRILDDTLLCLACFACFSFFRSARISSGLVTTFNVFTPQLLAGDGAVAGDSEQSQHVYSDCLNTGSLVTVSLSLKYIDNAARQKSRIKDKHIFFGCIASGEEFFRIFLGQRSREK